MTQTKPPLILASASPRRKALLESVGLRFTVLVTDIDESVRKGENPQNYVSRLAQEKARAAYHDCDLELEPVILAADTIVCQGLNIFSKPSGRDDAFRIWQHLSGSTHQVMSGVCVMNRDKIDTRVIITEVRFASISPTQMSVYWDSGEPQDKAGGYAIQGLASAWVKDIQGSYSNVVGLPLYEVNQMLASANLNWM